MAGTSTTRAGAGEPRPSGGRRGTGGAPGGVGHRPDPGGAVSSAADGDGPASPGAHRRIEPARLKLRRRPVADALRPLFTGLFGGDPPVRVELWDGTAVGPPDGPGAIQVRSAAALRRLVWAPGELGLARAYVSGDVDVSGDVFAVLLALRHAAPRSAARGRRGGRGARASFALDVLRALPAVTAVGALGLPPPPPVIESRPRGRLHSAGRDAASVTYHYDVGNDFYRLLLGPSMTYSCARFTDDDRDLERAQQAKHDLVCRKLGLHERRGARLLDVGCGWGSLLIHAARHYGARSVGVTLSRPQAELARRRADEEGVGDRVEVRVQDYRDLGGEEFDAVSSVGMSEHVGLAQLPRYFRVLRGVLAPGGRLCNHAISSPGGSRVGPRTFVGRYVFPDGELVDAGRVVLAMEEAGLEVRDVESLREHYALTLRAWVANLQDHWEEAAALVGEPRARVWRLYMAASANGFEDGGIAVHQVLGVRPDATGASGMPRTRRGWG